MADKPKPGKIKEDDEQTKQGKPVTSSEKKKWFEIVDDKNMEVGKKEMTAEEYVRTQIDNVSDWFLLSNLLKEDPEFATQFSEMSEEIAKNKEEIEKLIQEYGHKMPESVIRKIKEKNEAFQSPEKARAFFEEKRLKNNDLFIKQMNEHVNDTVKNLSNKYQSVVNKHAGLADNKAMKDIYEDISYLGAGDEKIKAKTDNKKIEQSGVDLLKQINILGTDEISSKNPEFNKAHTRFKKHFLKYNPEYPVPEDYLNQEFNKKATIINKKDVWKQAFNDVLSKKRESIYTSLHNFEVTSGRLTRKLDNIDKYLSINNPAEELAKDLGVKPEQLETFFTKEEADAWRNNKITPDMAIKAAEVNSEGNKEDRKIKDEQGKEVSKEEKDKLAKKAAEISKETEDTLKTGNPFVDLPKSIESMINEISTNINKIETAISDKDTSLTDQDKTAILNTLNKLKKKIDAIKNDFNDYNELVKPGIDDNKWGDDGKKEHEKNLKDMVDELKTINIDCSKIEESMNKLGTERVKNAHIKSEWRFVSLNSFWLTIKTYFDLFKDQYKRIDEESKTYIQEVAGKGLKKVTGGRWKKFFSIGEQRAQTDRESHDQEERGKWKYANIDDPHMINQLKKEKAFEDNQHFRAHLEEMAKRGILRWDDPMLWEHFTKFCKIKMPKAAYKNMQLRDSYLEEMAIQTFNDKNWFKQYKGENSKNFVSSYEKLDRDTETIEHNKETAKRLGMILEKQYEMHNESKKYFNQTGGQAVYESDAKSLSIFSLTDKDVNPFQYVSMLNNAIKVGGITTEQKFFYIVRGIATGLLSMEFLTHLESKGYFNGEWPMLNFFRGIKREDLLKVDKILTGGKTNFEKDNLRAKNFFYGNIEVIEKYINNELSYNPGIIDRTQRIIERWEKVDKDVSQNELARNTAPDVITLIKGVAGGRQTVSARAAMNGLTGWSTRLGAFDIYKKRYTSEEKTSNIQQMKSQLASFIVCDSMIRKRIEYTNQATSLDAGKYNEIAGMASNSQLSVAQFTGIMKNFLTEAFCSTNFTYKNKNWQETSQLLFDDDYLGKFEGKTLSDKQNERQNFTVNLVTNYFPQFFSQGSANEKKLLYLIEKWQAMGAFASYNDGRNANKLGTTQYSYQHGKRVSQTLQFDEEEFNNWKNPGDYFKIYGKNHDFFAENQNKSHIFLESGIADDYNYQKAA